MHEFGMCDGIVEAVQWRANGRRVARVKIRVGVMHRVVKEAFQQAFSARCRGNGGRKRLPRHCCSSCPSCLSILPGRIRKRGSRNRVREVWRGGSRSSRRRRTGSGVHRIRGNEQRGSLRRNGVCLGIAGQIIEFVSASTDLARVNVFGVERVVNVGLVANEGLKSRRLGADSRRLCHSQDG